MLEKIKLATVEKNGYSKFLELGMERRGNSIICQSWGQAPEGTGSLGKISKNRTRVKETAGKAVKWMCDKFSCILYFVHMIKYNRNSLVRILDRL